jgi:hypothetical protein
MSASDWGSEYDPASGKYFYFNDATGETAWEPPPGWDSGSTTAFAAGAAIQPHSEWITELDPSSGKYFYVNLATQETTWEMPPDYQNLDDLRAENPSSESSTGPRSPLSAKWKKAFTKVRMLVALNHKFAKPSWEKHFDDETGEFYYHNTVTGKSTWIEPKSLHFEPRGPVSPSGKKKRPGTWEDDQQEEGGEGGGKVRSRPQSRDKNGSRPKKKKKKKDYDIKPFLQAAMNGDMDAMMAAMEVGAATSAKHRGRSLFSGHRNSGLDAAEKEKKEGEEGGEGGKGENGASGGKKGDEGGNEEEEELDGNGEPVGKLVMSQKAKDHYRVQEFRRKRFSTIINQANDGGTTALHSAAIRGQENIIRKLLELGADLNVRDKALNTPLILATQKGHLRAVYILMRAGADPSLRSKYGQTAYDVARYRGYLRIARLFEEGEKEFDIVEMYVDRKWYQVDVHMVRHGKTHMVPVEDTTFYIKTKYRTKAMTHHIGLH